MYEAHFGLAELPFRNAPDPRFYVDARPHRAAIRALLEGAGSGRDFTPLVGDFGSGKTTLARRMRDEADPARHVVAELPHVRVEGDELLDRIAEALGLSRPKAAPPMARLISQLEALARSGRDAWLLADEADSLSVGALNRLRKLAAVRVDGRAALHVFLLGRSTSPAIDELARVGRPLNIGAAVRIAPLDAAGTHDYILQRLRRAGWTGNPVFDPRTTAEIHARCQGTPGRVNRLCGRILLHLFMQGRRELDVGVVCAVDELLHSELSGEPSGFDLPTALPSPSSPPARPRADREAPVLTTIAGDLDLDIEVPPAASSRPVATAPRPPSSRPAAPVAIKSAEASRRRAAPPRRPLPRGLSAVALLIAGGVLWHTISQVATTYRQQARFAAAAATLPGEVAAASVHDAAPTPVAAASALPAPADVLAAAERALSQAPPAAGPPVVADGGLVHATPPLHKGQKASTAKATRALPATVASACEPTRTGHTLCQPVVRPLP